MELIGHQFTWERSRGKPGWMEVRLDRVVTTEAWLDLFPMAKLYNLEGSTSNHSPIFLVPKKSEGRSCQNTFRFENAWLLNPMCSQLVKESWEGAKGEDIQEKIQRCGERLSAWGKEVTSNFGTKIKACKIRLKRLRSGRDAQSLDQFEVARNQLHRLLEQREIF